MEDVLKASYSNIKSRPVSTKVTSKGSYKVTVDVEKYSDEHMEALDLIKIVTVSVQYTNQNKAEIYKISTLATK